MYIFFLVKKSSYHKSITEVVKKKRNPRTGNPRGHSVIRHRGAVVPAASGRVPVDTDEIAALVGFFVVGKKKKIEKKIRIL